jgi:glucose-6-phosphate-specific signal transduction histidine kinase
MSNLHQLIGHLADRFLPIAVRRHSFFVNNIPPELQIDHNDDVLTTVLSGMLSEVVSHTNDSCIRFSARRYGYVIVLEMQQCGNGFRYSESIVLQQVQQLAEKIGGCLHINQEEPAKSIIALSFPNLPAVA